MPTFNLLPDGTTGTNQWQNPANGTCAASNVDADNGDTDYCYEVGHSQEITFTMANPSVVESDIDSITSVKIYISSAYTHGVGNTTRILIYQTGGSISNGFTAVNVDGGGAYATYSGTAETTSDGSTAWTYSDLEDLQVKLDKIVNTASRTMVRVSYLYAEVSYVAAAAVYGHSVNGVASANIGSVNGVATANVGKVIGVD